MFKANNCIISVFTFSVRSSYPDEAGYVNHRQKDLQGEWADLKVSHISRTLNSQSYAKPGRFKKVVCN